MEKIIEIITKGLLKDLHIAERSLYLNRKISELRDKIPKGTKSDISTMLYDLTYTELVLSLSRLYDSLNERYPTRCIRQLYETLRNSSFEPETKEEKAYALRELKRLVAFPELNFLLLERHGREFNETLVNYLETLEFNDPIAPAIEKLKEVRDKFLAHNEDVEIDTLIPYTSLELLISHAKDVTAFFSLYCSGVHLTANGEFYLSHSALLWGRKYEEFISNDSE